MLLSFQAWDQALSRDDPARSPGILSTAELAAALRRDALIHELADPGRVEELVEVLDATSDGQISVFEFLAAFLSDATAPDWMTSQGIQMAACVDDAKAFLFAHRLALLRGCRAIDAQGEGQLIREHFIEVATALVEAKKELAVGSVHEELHNEECLNSHLADLKSRLPEVIAYEEFLAGLQVVDKTTSSTRRGSE